MVGWRHCLLKTEDEVIAGSLSMPHKVIDVMLIVYAVLSFAVATAGIMNIDIVLRE